MIVVVLLLIVVSAGFFTWFNLGQQYSVGSNSEGYVTKEVFNHYGAPNARIVVVTGMHPREDLATNMVPYIVKLFAMLNRVEMVNYKVTVVDNPKDFAIGRNNGESLVAEYVVPDIKKSNYQLVIIAHDHQPGYGEGYYIATPTNDQNSISMGEAVQQLIPQFNFYQGSSTAKHASSVIIVDRPLAQTGFPVFVYEMPEVSNPMEAAYWTYKLFQASYDVVRLKNNT